MLEVKLIDWDAAYTPFFGFGGMAGGGYYGGPPDPRRGARRSAACWTATTRSPKVRLAAFEAAIVESGVHNLYYGDRDSLGRLPAAPEPGLGHARSGHERRLRGDASSSRARSAPTAARAPASWPRTCSARPSRNATTRSRCRPRRCSRSTADAAAARAVWRCASLLTRLRRARRRGPGGRAHAGPGGLRAGGGGAARAADVRCAQARSRRRPRSPGRSTAARSASSTSTGTVAIEPATLETASDVTLEGRALDSLGRGRRRGRGRAAAARLPADLRRRRHRRAAGDGSSSRASRRATGGATSTTARCVLDAKDSPSASSPPPTCARPVEARWPAARAGAVAAHRAGRARDQLAAPATGPRRRRTASARARARRRRPGQITASTSLPVPQ